MAPIQTQLVMSIYTSGYVILSKDCRYLKQTLSVSHKYQYLPGTQFVVE
jgi:hypothetical protein